MWPSRDSKVMDRGKAFFLDWEAIFRNAERGSHPEKCFGLSLEDKLNPEVKEQLLRDLRQYGKLCDHTSRHWNTDVDLTITEPELYKAFKRRCLRGDFDPYLEAADYMAEEVKLELIQ